MRWQHKEALELIRIWCKENGRNTFASAEVGSSIRQSMRTLHDNEYVEKAGRELTWSKNNIRCYRQVWRVIK